MQNDLPNGQLYLAVPACFTLGRAPALAQVNLAGVWNNLQILHEDEPERLPGPELGDYLGVPI